MLRRQADLPHTDVHGRPVPPWWRSWHALVQRAAKLPHFLKALTHFGAPRLLRYTFHGGLPLDLVLPTASGLVTLPRNTRLMGQKSLVYVAGGNPWEQLLRMPLHAELPSGERLLLTTLDYDALYMLSRDDGPLQVLSQADGITGLRDTLSLLLYAARVVFSQHFLSFRAPEPAAHRPLQRLPQAWPDDDPRFAGLELSVHDLPAQAGAVDASGHASQALPALRLTRIRRKSLRANGASSASSRPAGEAQPCPILLLHGLGSSGVQFTHAAIPMPMAQFMAQQACDVWVGELRTSIGLPSHRRQWVMDDVALQDVPRLVQAVRRATGAQQIDVIAHCIGSAMLWMALLAGKLRDPGPQTSNNPGWLRRMVSMQVGPVLRLPRGNRARGYLGNRLQNLAGLGMAQSTVDDTGTDADTSVDRLLGSLPFLGGFDPQAWRERLRATDAGLRWSGDLRHNGRLVNARRSAGVFAQLFQWPNMDSPDLLDALPDMLGGVNLTTYQQTAQYTFLQQLTNQDAEVAYVTDDNIQRHLDNSLGILFVQGRLNDVFGPHGSWESARMIRRVKGSAQPVARLQLRRDDECKDADVPDYGHLDCVTGLRAHLDVFPRMLAFLRAPELNPFVIEHTLGLESPPAFSAQAERRWRFRPPSVGPWLGHVLPQAGGCRLRIGLKTDEARALPALLATVWVAGDQPITSTLILHAIDAMPSSPPPWMVPAQGEADGEAVLEVDLPWSLGDVRLSADDSALSLWICAPELGGQPLQATQAIAQLQGDGPREGFLHDWGQARARRVSGLRRYPTPVDSLLIDGGWLKSIRASEVAISVIQPMRFALVSCRMSPMLTDRRLADAGFGRLLSQIDGLRHVLMVGDQVYADAMSAANGVEQGRLRYADAHREAWTSPNQREAMRRRPHYMAADDHEFTNNYHDADKARHPLAWAAARAIIWRYQYAAGPAGMGRPARTVQGADQRIDQGVDQGVDQNSDAPHFWYSFEAGAQAFFVADTRSERIDGGRVDRTDAQIMSDDQFGAIETWLQMRRAGIAFLVLPTPVAPVMKDEIGPSGHALRADNWMRYPQSLAKLLQLIHQHAPQRLVLLSGDYHCFVNARLTLRSVPSPTVLPREVKVQQIVTSGIYCPYSFANTERAELHEPAPDEWLRAGTIEWRYALESVDGAAAFALGSGHTEIDVDADGRVRPSFVAAAPLHQSQPLS